MVEQFCNSIFTKHIFPHEVDPDTFTVNGCLNWKFCCCCFRCVSWYWFCEVSYIFCCVKWVPSCSCLFEVMYNFCCCCCWVNMVDSCCWLDRVVYPFSLIGCFSFKWRCKSWGKHDFRQNLDWLIMIDVDNSTAEPEMTRRYNFTPPIAITVALWEILQCPLANVWIPSFNIYRLSSKGEIVVLFIAMVCIWCLYDLNVTIVSMWDSLWNKQSLYDEF